MGVSASTLDDFEIDMFDLKTNTVLHMKMNDNAANPFVASLNGVPTELVLNNYFSSSNYWDWSSPQWTYESVPKVAAFYGYAAPSPLSIDIGAISGKKYLLVYTRTGGPQGDCQPAIGGQSGILRTDAGTYAEIITAGSANSLLIIYGIKATPPPGSFSIDNVFCICLDDFPNTGVFSDSTGNPWTQSHDVTGKINGALGLDGLDDSIMVFDQGSCEFPANDQDFSFWIWFKRNSTSQTEFLFDKRDGATDGWQLRFTNINDRLWFNINGAGVVGDTAVTDSNWHLAMVVVNRATTAQIYLDNIADGAPLDVSSQAMSVSNDLTIGASYINSGQLDGQVDIAGVVNKALSADERAFIWNNGNGTERLWGYDYRAAGRGIMRGVTRGVR